MTENKQKKFKTLDLAYIGLSVALITVCSWISFPLTIPITLQTLGICLVAGLFGMKRGTVSTLVYLILGTVGVPLFAQFTGGLGIITGPSGGYLIGFIFTALIVGFAADKWNGKLAPLIISMIVGVLICYAFGTAWFAYIYAKKSQPASLLTILGWCVFPFIPFDAIKIILAALLTNRLKKYIK